MNVGQDQRKTARRETYSNRQKSLRMSTQFGPTVARGGFWGWLQQWGPIKVTTLKSPTFGGVRDFTSALPVLIGPFCLSGLFAYFSISSKPGVVGWIGGAFFSFCAASLGFSVVRGAIRLIRSGNTQRPQAS